MLGCLKDIFWAVIILISLGLFIFGFSISIVLLFLAILIFGMISIFIPDSNEDKKNKIR
jgi:hypothetical protein